MFRKFIGIDQLISHVLSKLGDTHLAYIVGDYARGTDSGIIDLVLVCGVDRSYLQNLISKLEPMIHRKICTLALIDEELEGLKGTLRLDGAITVWVEGSA